MTSMSMRMKLALARTLGGLLCSTLGAAQAKDAPRSLAIQPAGTWVALGASKSFSCTGGGTQGKPCSWSIAEGASGGAIDDAGHYTAPRVSGTYHVIATSPTAPDRKATATVWVPPAGTGIRGEWIPLNLPERYEHVDSVLVDPVRPNDVYVFLYVKEDQPMKVVKSTDYGRTWKHLATPGANGYPWGADIDPNPERDPTTPPTLYTPSGYGSYGLWKSTDGGRTWKDLFENGPGALGPYNQWGEPPERSVCDLYGITVLPDDPPNHVLATFHERFRNSNDAGIAESKDGGATWEVHVPPVGFGQSQYLVIIDANTWLAVSQDTGIWRTTTAGRTKGVIGPDAWTKVDAMPHFHGSFHVAQTSTGLYLPGVGGVKRSQDGGATWSYVYRTNPGGYMSGVVATAKNLYADFVSGPSLLRSSIADGTTWSPYTTTPPGMKDGSGSFHGIASTTDGTRWFVISGNIGSGAWRYTE